CLSDWSSDVCSSDLYWEHTIRNESDFEHHVDYVHYNPVRHGLVAKVSDWPYSSFHRYVKLGILPIDWAGDFAECQSGYGERRWRSEERRVGKEGTSL